ncbi:MAG: FGGY-family carbohydrate kinase [Defluviitaleaceae bacterium]|nr:FGGY-family carbohydrate kinase [Defluviitaleaceae bacterium]
MKSFLGIELGSTRIKSVLVGEDFKPMATGAYEWENKFENGFWTYSLEEVWEGVRASVSALGVGLGDVAGIGVSAMMHGYLAFDTYGNLLADFRTWRNTTTEKAAEELTKRFNFNVPQRWSIAHLYQAILNGEPHVGDVAFMTTLAGYVHWKLTGEKVLGVGDASGMFPLEGGEYSVRMADVFSGITNGVRISEIFPRILAAGETAGRLTEEGARLLGSGLRAGIKLCPPEGDAGTGMVATNSIAPRTGNISAGTSVFAMIVLEKDLKNVYTEIDMVTTPTGKPVAMVHCNNCTSDLDAWVRVIGESLACFGVEVSKSELYEKLYGAAVSDAADADCGGLLAYNFFSGEPIVGLDEGRPLFVRAVGANFTLANFMRSLLFSSMATLRIGMEILRGEDVALEKIQGHGGLFKTPGVAQKLMAAALNTPVSVMETAGEGGAWGMALLAAYMGEGGGDTLDEFLMEKVFVNSTDENLRPVEKFDVDGFEKFLQNYRSGLAVQKAAVECV